MTRDICRHRMSNCHTDLVAFKRLIDSNEIKEKIMIPKRLDPSASLEEFEKQVQDARKPTQPSALDKKELELENFSLGASALEVKSIPTSHGSIFHQNQTQTTASQSVSSFAKI